MSIGLLKKVGFCVKRSFEKVKLFSKKNKFTILEKFDFLKDRALKKLSFFKKMTPRLLEKFNFLKGRASKKPSRAFGKV